MLPCCIVAFILCPSTDQGVLRFSFGGFFARVIMMVFGQHSGWWSLADVCLKVLWAVIQPVLHCGTEACPIPSCSLWFRWSSSQVETAYANPAPSRVCRVAEHSVMVWKWRFADARWVLWSRGDCNTTSFFCRPCSANDPGRFTGFFLLGVPGFHQTLILNQETNIFSWVLTCLCGNWFWTSFQSHFSFIASVQCECFMQTRKKENSWRKNVPGIRGTNPMKLIVSCIAWFRIAL